MGRTSIDGRQLEDIVSLCKKAQDQINALDAVLASDGCDQLLAEKLLPQTEPLQRELLELAQFSVVLFGERGCGKSSLWNAIVQPARTEKDAVPVRLLPSRAFGTCSAVPVELSRGESDVFTIEYHFDRAFIVQINNLEERPSGARVNAAMKSSFMANIAASPSLCTLRETVASLDDVRRCLALHCTLPVMVVESRHDSRWPFLERVCVIGPFDETVVPPGVLLTDAPGFGDENRQQSAMCEHALKGASLVLHVVDCNHFLQPSTAIALMRALQANDGACVVVTKFLDTLDVQQLKAILRDEFTMDATTELDSVGDDDGGVALRAAIAERLSQCFRSMAKHTVMTTVGSECDRANLCKLITKVKIFPVSARNYSELTCKSVAATGIVQLQKHLKRLLVDDRLGALQRIERRVRDLWTIGLPVGVNEDPSEKLIDSWCDELIGTATKRGVLLEELGTAVRDALSTLLASIAANRSRDLLVASMRRLSVRPHHETMHKALRDASTASIEGFVSSSIMLVLDKLERLPVLSLGDPPPGLAGDAQTRFRVLYTALSRALLPDGDKLRRVGNTCIKRNITLENIDMPQNKKDLSTFPVLAKAILEATQRSCDEIANAYCNAMRDRFVALINESQGASIARQIKLQTDICDKFKNAVTYHLSELHACESIDNAAAAAADSAGGSASTSTSVVSVCSPGDVIKLINEAIVDKLDASLRQFVDVSYEWCGCRARLTSISSMYNLQHCQPDEKQSNLKAPGPYTKKYREQVGEIYVMTNDSFKTSIVKIGRTTRLSRTRAKELSKATGVPTSFKVHLQPVPRVRGDMLVERVLHNILRGSRLNMMREFFRIPPDDAAAIVSLVANLAAFRTK